MYVTEFNVGIELDCHFGGCSEVLRFESGGEPVGSGGKFESGGSGG